MMLACPVELLNRLQAEFSDLAKAAIDPQFALWHFRADTSNATPEQDERRQAIPATCKGGPLSPIDYAECAHGMPHWFRDLGWESCPEAIRKHIPPRLYGVRKLPNQLDSEGWFRVQGWCSGPTNADPGSMRWWFVYCDETDRQRLLPLLKDAGTFILSTRGTPLMPDLCDGFRGLDGWESTQDILPTSPPFTSDHQPTFNLGSAIGLWLDIVASFNLRRLARVPSAVGRIDITTNQDDGFDSLRTLRRADWYGPDRPAEIAIRFDGLCRTSVHVLAAIRAGWEQIASAGQDAQPAGAEPSRAAKEPAVDYGLTVDTDKRTITRAGYDVTVDLYRAGVQWSIFKATFDNRGKPLSADQRATLEGDPSARRNAKSNLNSKLGPLGLQVDKDFRLTNRDDIPSNAR